MNSFDIAVALVLEHEGGYVNNPKDPGGETNFGISKRYYPNLDIKNLTQEQAINIYKTAGYWKSWMELVPSQQLANCALDCSVNQGPAACRQMYDDDLRTFQLRRLLRYANTLRTENFHSWFSRTLDVG